MNLPLAAAFSLSVLLAAGGPSLSFTQPSEAAPANPSPSASMAPAAVSPAPEGPEPTAVPGSNVIPEPAGSAQATLAPGARTRRVPLIPPTAMPVPRFGGAPGARSGPILDGYAAVGYALQHAPALLAARATISNDDVAYTRDRAAEYPALGGMVQNQIQKESNAIGNFGQFGLAPVNNFSQNTAQLQTTYNLFNGGAQLTAQQALRTTQAAKYELRRLEEQTAIDVTSAFYNLAALHEVVLIDGSDLGYQEALLGNARASERVGRVAGVDVLRAQVAVGRSRSVLIQARVDERNAAEALAVQVGAPTGTTFALPKDIPEPPAPTTSSAQLATIAKLNRPEILEAKANFAASKLGDAAVDNDLRPTVQLGASFGSQVSPTEFVQEQQQIDAQNAAAVASYNAEKSLFPNLPIPVPVPIPPIDRNRPGFWQFNVTSTFAVPLYDYGQRAALHHAARAQIDASLASLYNAYDSVEADVDAARRNLDSAATKLAIAKQSAALGRQTARIAQLQYKNGLISFTDAAQTEQTALSAENDLVAARVTYVTALIRLRISLAPANTAAAADLRGLD